MKRSVFVLASVLSAVMLSAPVLAGIWVIEPDESQKTGLIQTEAT
ncbi:hypothetical protein BN137_2486 [Cronobacter condimenti 1330]|uniref:Uncharacterized protein n=1 Tax=Cronobacter condimenti 1330 TaxID=1073999 RepID=K8A1X1_9ENTR|nr:hypothetical protein BN137_2486 [Cronobacter condimenti 1330]